MKIFMSWSGARSKAVAEILSEWLRCVIQASTPWVSTRDIERGAIWFSEINENLKDTSVGIVCLTQENKNNPWILFETGALAKGLSSNRVCTFLVDLTPEDIVDPLAQFNHTVFDKESVRSLVKTINNSLGEKSLHDIVIDRVFNTYWSQFENDFNKILRDTPQSQDVTPRPDNEILSEILSNTRTLNRRVKDLENKNVYSIHKDHDFDFSVKEKIYEMILTDKYTKKEMAKKIQDYDMPYDYAYNLVNEVIEKSGFEKFFNKKE